MNFEIKGKVLRKIRGFFTENDQESFLGDWANPCSETDHVYHMFKEKKTS